MSSLGGEEDELADEVSIKRGGDASSGHHVKGGRTFQDNSGAREPMPLKQLYENRGAGDRWEKLWFGVEGMVVETEEYFLSPKHPPNAQIRLEARGLATRWQIIFFSYCDYLILFSIACENLLKIWT